MGTENSPHIFIPTTPSCSIAGRGNSVTTEAADFESVGSSNSTGSLINVAVSDHDPIHVAHSPTTVHQVVEEGKNEDVKGMSEAYGNKKPASERKKRARRPRIQLDDVFESAPKTPKPAKERRVTPKRKYVRKNKSNVPSVLQEVAVNEQLPATAEVDVIIEEQPPVEVNVAVRAKRFLNFDLEGPSDDKLIQVAESTSIYTPLLRACRGAMELRCQCILCRIEKIKPAFPKEYKKSRTSIRLAMARRRMLLPTGRRRRIEDSFKCTLALAHSFLPATKKRKRRMKKAFVQGMSLGISDPPTEAAHNDQTIPNGLNHSIKGKKKATNKKATKDRKKHNNSLDKEAKDIMGDASQDEMLMVEIIIPTALVPYEKKSLIPNALVPYKKKSKTRLEVDLDPETMRISNLLKDREDSSDPVKDEAETKQKWWEKERGSFCAKAVLFVRLMRLVLGNRTFSPWKGSVVDSVVGVYLTQNVADKLSSSAFMSLVARYPVKLPSEDTSMGRTKDLLSKEIQNVLDKAGEDVCVAETSTTPQQHMDPSDSSNATNANNQTPESKPEQKGEDKDKDDMKINWDTLRTTYSKEDMGKHRSPDTLDSVDWEAVRMAHVDEIAKAIEDRGQHNILAQKIKDFLNRILKDHGSIDLEWLRYVPPQKAKEYLLDIYGLGLKSVECLRLLTLHHHAFPVDTNVGRIVIRLGWVPLQPMDESLQIHLLENYPLMDKIQAYLWPRLCHLDQKTLYELHYMLITFGKVFCTKRKPSCTTCPLRGECKHYASACARGRLALPGSKKKSDKKTSTKTNRDLFEAEVSLLALDPMDDQLIAPLSLEIKYSEPIIEEPPSPERVIERNIENLCSEDDEDIPDIEDLCSKDSDEIHYINLCDPRLTEYMNQNEEKTISNALVILSSQAASNPVPKQKMSARLRTEHQVYELPDHHPLLIELEMREPDDPSPYLLAIWTQDKSQNSFQPPENSECEEQDHQTVPGTILIPCRSAMRGSFPLNGTYFQVNEVFADDESSKCPINVPRAWLWRLTKRTLHCGHSTTAISRDVPLLQLQQCFNEGFVCLRGFNRKTRAPKQLSSRFHPPAVKGKQKKYEE